jgi:KDO2-lipid IV(A) lauroyltransferase
MREDTRRSDVRWYARGLNNGAIFGATYHGVARLPKRVSYGIGYVGTWLAYHLMQDGTSGLLANLRVVCPERTESDLENLALFTYRSYARDTVDFIRSLFMTSSELSEMISEFDGGLFDELRAEGRGIITLGGHFGNWELGGVVLRRLRGLPLSVVGRPEPSPAVGELRRRMRETFGIETIEIGRVLDTALRIRRVLAQNGVVGMLADRHLDRDRAAVTFFGRPTFFSRSPAMIASLSGAPLLPCFVLRQKDGRFAARCGRPIRVDGSKPVDVGVNEATQEFATQLEERIRMQPYLWYQFYRYWAR